MHCLGIDRPKSKCMVTLENGFAHAMESGLAIVHGSVGDSVGAYSRDGLIGVYGNAGRRTGVGLNGGQVFIRGSVGSQAAHSMKNGTIIIGGSAGKHLGWNMTGGVIYIRGEVESLAPNMEENRIKEPDRFKISLILLKAGIKGPATEFRAFRSTALASTT